MKAVDNARMRELVLHVARRCEQHDLFGVVKLNKILFYADLRGFLAHGRSISGVDYVKKSNGPVPEGMSALLVQMQDDRSIVELERDMPDTTVQRRPVALARADLASFSANEIAIIDEVIDWVRPMSARHVSDLSHELPGWKAARFDEVIPYATAFVPGTPVPLTDDEQARVRLALQALPAA